MTTLSNEQREKLGQELGALSRTAHDIGVAMSPFVTALQGLNEAKDLVLERYGVSEPIGACESCERLLFEGDDGHRTADDVLLCAEDAPTFGDLKKQLTETAEGAAADPDEEDETGIAPRERLAAIEAHVANGGALTDKIVHPL